MQLEFFDVPSPCIGICQSDEKGYCLGCMRTRDERQSWIDLNLDDKQKLIKRCIQRKKRKEGKGKIKIVVEEQTVVQPSLLEPLVKSNINNFSAKKINTENSTKEKLITDNTTTDNSIDFDNTDFDTSDFDFSEFEL
ncbi:MAG: DUF1289 domain-containing protein [Alteromonadaceae bacterium]|nr:DUF1289 domain-containing protein [Alteromonadaceae bacterium]